VSLARRIGSRFNTRQISFERDSAEVLAVASFALENGACELYGLGMQGLISLDIL
jgi:hypothetical protein